MGNETRSLSALSTRAYKFMTVMVYSDKTYVGMGLGPGLIQCQSTGPI